MNDFVKAMTTQTPKEKSQGDIIGSGSICRRKPPARLLDGWPLMTRTLAACKYASGFTTGGQPSGWSAA